MSVSPIPHPALVRLFLVVLLWTPLMAMECSDNPLEEALAGDEDTLIDIVKTNFDTEAIHIFSRFEGFPCCQVLPGVPDDSSNILVSKGEQVQFTAGRSGTLISGATATCTVTDRALDEGFATVEFRLDQSLRCLGW